MILMSPNVSQADAGPAPEASPMMRQAMVVASGGNGLRIAIDGVVTAASRALSCAIEPLAGDDVLVWALPGDCHVLAVIRRGAALSEAAHRQPWILETQEPVDDAPTDWLAPAASGGSLPYQPHFDSQSDGEAAVGRPWTRFDVPLTPNAFGSGTYLRMGAYVEGQEGAMMPALELSKSTAVDTTKTAPTPDFMAALLSGKNPYSAAAETANAAKVGDASTTGTASGDAKQGYLKRGDSFVKNKAGQMELMSISTTAVTTTSSGDGFLGKTDADVNLSIDGGMLVDIVKGQTTNVSDGDIKFTAPAGLFAVNALSGISLTAGTAADPANISLLAYGYVKNEAKGPLSEWFYSTSEKKTYGFAKDWFYGEKYSEFHGTSTSKFYGNEDKTFHGTATSYFMGDQFTTNLAARVSMTMAATLTLALGTEFRLNFSIDLKINLSVDMNIILGIAFKMVVGMDSKVVVGFDMKYVIGFDLKKVGIGLSWANIDLKNEAASVYWKGAQLKSGSIEVDSKPTKVGIGQWLKV
jgi:hypothetical protein